MARPSKFTTDEIGHALRRVKDGTPAAQMCRTLGITETTFYRWRRQYDSVEMSELHDVRKLRDENQKLKQIVANMLLEKL